MDLLHKCPYLPLLNTTGSHYDIGYSVGLTFTDAIKRVWNESAVINDILKPYAASADGQKYLKESLEVCSKNFPQYIREIRGMADGAVLAFEDVFLLNMSREIQGFLSPNSLLAKDKEIASCSDVFINTKNCTILAHNEDCSPFVISPGYLVNARVVEDGVETEAFTSFSYPGLLPGAAVSFNRHGMMFTVNSLTPDFVVHGAPSRLFINRSVLKARNVEEATELMRNRGYGVAYGFNCNVMDVKVPMTMWAVEVGPQAEESLVHVHAVEQELDVTKPCHYFHFNSFKHLKISETQNLSSVTRQDTAEKLPPPKTRRDAMKILGDVSNKEFPIFRTPRKTDVMETAFTAVADLPANKVQIFQGNPAKDEALPLFTFSILEK